MWHTVVAKFFGLSRMGVRALSQFGVLGPLTSLDRTWKALLDKYMKTTWYPISYEFVWMCQLHKCTDCWKCWKYYDAWWLGM